MSKIRVDTDILDKQQEQMRDLVRQLRQISSDVAAVSAGLSWKISSAQQIRSSVNISAACVEQLEQKTNRLSAVLGTISGQYLRTERKNAGLKSGWEKFWDGELAATVGGSVFGWASEDGQASWGFLNGEASASLKPKYGEYKDEKAKKIVEQRKIQDESKQINPDKKWYDKKGTILEAGAEAKAEGSILEGKIGTSGEAGNISLEGQFLKGEAHAKGEAGLYVYDKDENGNITRIFSPGVAAEVGASVAVLSAAASGRLGLGEDNNMLGIYGEGEASVASAEAKAGFSVNRNEVRAQAKAEANLVEAKGTAGISVLGTDIGVSGSVKVGVGAHADIGYTDGKLKVDIGAAIGVGVSVGFEVDIGGTVDAVCGWAQSAWNWLTG